jgi:lysyl endopeptidase
MRRTVGVLVGACTLLALAGAAGTTVYVFNDTAGATVGSWQPAPGVSRTAAEVVLSAATTQHTTVPTIEPAARVAAAVAATRAAQIESATDASTGHRQRVGTLKKVNKLIGYAGAPQRQTFRFPLASYVKLHFDRMMLLPGDYVTVSDASGEEAYRYEAPPLPDVDGLVKGAVTGKASDRWAMSVTGDTAVLELHRAATDTLGLGSALSRLGVGVDRVARGYSQAEQERAGAVAPEPTAPGSATPGSAGRGSTGREESVCAGDQSHDAVCYRSSDPVAYTRSEAIARLLINGTELCTGWRVGAKNRMLTNNHCFDNSDDAYDTEVWFNYRCAVCGRSATVRPTKVWGDRVVLTNRTYDFTLFTVDGFDRIQKYGYLALDTRRPNRNEELYVPQHPAGEPLRIAGALGEKAGNCKAVDRAYDGYATDSDVSYYCDTQGGSSGSPVLSRATNKVIALHHFGGCPNSGVRADLILTRIKNLI